MAVEQYEIGNNRLTIELADKILTKGLPVTLSEEARENVFKCRSFLDKKLEDGKTYYGVNTGFGALHNIIIPADKLSVLQENMLMSHACGTGDEVPDSIVKLMLLLKIQSLSYGYSGVDLSTLWRLIDFFNNGVLPVIYEQGSLGASGDLAPLAHLCLPLIGKGEVRYENKNYETGQLFKHFKWKALKLQSKEGIALLNGTQFMSAYGVEILSRSRKLLWWTDVIAAMSCDAFDCKTEPFTASLHKLRPHKGQLETAAAFRHLLEGSEIAAQEKEQVQDPYSFRCIPQVHGASKDAIDYCMQVLETEINSVTDNPNIIMQDDAILSGGNFHGQPLALSLDFLAIALSELANISERRIYQLVSGQRKLPPFLIKEPGLNSGMMITQYTAASIVSQNKQLCTPASVDSIVSSNGQEDHVSMGANAATKCYKVLKNTEQVIAIELMNAAQALEFRRPLQSGHIIEKVMSAYRKIVPFNANDHVMTDDIRNTVNFIKQDSSLFY